MARINLLPWREAERQRRQREFLVMAGVAVAVTVAVGVALHLQVEQLISGQGGRNAFLEREIAELDEQIKEIETLEKTKESLLSRMRVIQELQRSRPEVVHLFDEIVNAVPAGVYLTSVEQQGSVVVVEGRAQSHARVSAMMRNIEGSNWVGNPVLDYIESKEDRRGRDQPTNELSKFKLKFQQKEIKAEEADVAV